MKALYRLFALTGLLGLAATPVAASPLADPPERVTDLAPPPAAAGSGAHFFEPEAEPVSHAYFAADDGIHGRELWRTDGTAAGTHLVADLCPGPCGADPGGVALGDTHFFNTWGWSEGEGRFQLWATDGTAETTRLLLPDAERDRTIFRGDLWFATGGRLWRSDGTPEGTRPVIDVCGDPCGVGPTGLAVAGDRLFFVAEHPELGVEPWTSDGTAAGTRPVADLCPGSCTSLPSRPTSFGDRVLFTATDGIHGREPWVSDGTPSGTTRLADVEPGPGDAEAGAFRSLGERALFLAHLFDSRQAPELWITDGAPAGTRRLEWALPAGDSEPLLGPLLPDGQLLLAVGVARQGDPYALYAVDLDRATTRLLASGLRWAAIDSGARVGNGYLFLSGGTGEAGRMELWRTDGTAAGTERVRAFDLGGTGAQPTNLVALDGGRRAVFSAPDGEHGQEPWVTDGTAAGTRLLRDVDPRGAGADPRQLARHDGWIYFIADAGAETGSLWRAEIDGHRVERVDAERSWSRLVEAGERLFVVSDDAREIVTVDGSGLEGVGSGELVVREPTAVGDRLFFGTPDQELWVVDGAGARRVTTVAPDLSPCDVGCEESVYPRHLTAAGGLLYFFAPVLGDPDNRTMLWRSDGSEAGTFPLIESSGIWIGTGRAGGRLVASWFEPESQEPLVWTSDGTREGTVRLETSAGEPLDAAVVAGDGERLFLAAFEDLPGRPDSYRVDLWVSDGTAAGTRELGAVGHRGTPVVFGGPEAVLGGPAAVVGGKLFFAADHPDLGVELWTSHGPGGSPAPVADLVPGLASSRPTGLTAVDGRLLFAAVGDDAGYELWTSDGTAAGTERLTDLHPGRGASNPAEITPAGDVVFFTATDGEGGRELWRAGLAGPAAPDAESPPPPAREPLGSPALPGFRYWVQLSRGGETWPGVPAAPCLAETACVAGALPDRVEVLLRVVGPKGNGRLWPTLVRFTTSRVEVWIEQVATGVVRYYVLDGARPGSSELEGLFDRDGFVPAGDG